LFGVVALVSLLVVLIGAWTLNARLRTWPSRALLICLGLIVVWIPLSVVVEQFVAERFESSSSQSTLNWLFVASDVFVPAVLLLLAAISFLLVARSVRPSISPLERVSEDVA
jgi:cytosine/uracil/thiamine/allantoin permease